MHITNTTSHPTTLDVSLITMEIKTSAKDVNMQSKSCTILSNPPPPFFPLSHKQIVIIMRLELIRIHPLPSPQQTDSHQETRVSQNKSCFFKDQWSVSVTKCSLSLLSMQILVHNTHPHPIPVCYQSYPSTPCNSYITKLVADLYTACSTPVVWEWLQSWFSIIMMTLTVYRWGWQT